MLSGRVRSGALLSSSSSCPRNLSLLIANNHFCVLDPFFLQHVFKQKNCVKTAIVLCIDEEGVMMIFNELEKSASRKDDFFLIGSFSIDEGSGNDDNATN